MTVRFRISFCPRSFSILYVCSINSVFSVHFKLVLNLAIAFMVSVLLSLLVERALSLSLSLNRNLVCGIALLIIPKLLGQGILSLIKCTTHLTQLTFISVNSAIKMDKVNVRLNQITVT